MAIIFNQFNIILSDKSIESNAFRTFELRTFSSAEFKMLCSNRNQKNMIFLKINFIFGEKWPKACMQRTGFAIGNHKP